MNARKPSIRPTAHRRPAQEGRARPPAATRTAEHAIPTARPASGGLRRSLLGAAAHAQAQDLGADGVGLTVLLGGGPVYAGSNAYTDAIDQVQYGLREGPCLSALASRHIIRSSTPRTTRRRWPRLSQHAADLALGSMLSVPIVVDDELLGSLNLYARHPRSLDGARPVTLSRAAGSAGDMVLSSRLLALVEDGSRSIGTALEDRAVVDLAVGLLMDRHACSAGEALVMVHQLARQDGVSAVAAAAELTASAGAVRDRGSA